MLSTDSVAKLLTCMMLRSISLLEALEALDNAQSHRAYWVDPYNEDRESTKRFQCFYDKIRAHPKKFFGYFRMSVTSFDELLALIRPNITKQWTVFRNPISAEERLTITLR